MEEIKASKPQQGETSMGRARRKTAVKELSQKISSIAPRLPAGGKCTLAVFTFLVFNVGIS